MSSLNPSYFRQELLTWYRQNKRDLPWRYAQGAPADPYKVWLSEIMLQQTTVTAVIPYFLKFIEQWPTLGHLAQTQHEEIMDAWAGLGYYSRARNLHKCAKQVMEEHKGIFPHTEKELLALSGIGPYTAAAICSIAYNKPANIVDGNVERVMARLFMCRKPLRDIKTLLKEHASYFIAEHEGAHSDYAQSLMELGALICTPKPPKCELCPVQIMCGSYKGNIQNTIPVAPTKKTKPKRYGYVYLIRNNKEEILVERREEKGLLAQTIGLPTGEWKTDKQELLHLSFYDKVNFDLIPQTINHIFTHFELELDVYESRLLKLKYENRYYWMDVMTLKMKLPSVFKKVYSLREAI